MFKVFSRSSLAVAIVAVTVSSFGSPAQAAPGSPVAGAGHATHQALGQVQQRFQRADFMEDTPKEIAMENRANPWQAWALAFFPTAIVKSVTLGLAFSMAETDQWAVFLPLIPSMGISHFWETKFTWAGLIALGGDIIGSSMITYYFSGKYSRTNPSDTLLYAGLGILAAFFVYENVSAPIFAMWRNRKLREQFMPSKGATAAAPSWRSSPYPDQGVAQFGPTLNQPLPVTAGWTFQF